MIRRGQQIRIRPEWQDKGDTRVRWFAIEDEDGGRVRIQPDNGLPIPGNQVVRVSMIECAHANTEVQPSMTTDGYDVFCTDCETVVSADDSFCMGCGGIGHNPEVCQ